MSLLVRNFGVHDRRHAVRDADCGATAHGRSLAPAGFLMYDFRTFNVDLLEAAMSELADRIKAALENFWEEHAIPADDGAATTVDELVGPVESMIAVEVLVTLDKITGMKLPNSIIQAGGYKTKDEFVNKLGAAVLAYVAKKSKS
ncbi:hypothetical protein [Paraburkholderia dioscoreae]|nr:hypothetical protein [Paraburkholderia dioscoreae]